ncbi:hypothetical protein GOBAR_DD13662 [Gossypium barbadense]|nr:hypothetical protein GOBAR_DD13662 [Gossypium barbadense]
MDAKFFVCVYFDGVILTTSVGCVFECRQQIAVKFNRNVSFDEMKAMINAKILRRCGKRISKIFYKFPVSTNPVKFVEMELVDDEDVETMVDLYCENGSDKNAPIHLFAELAEESGGEEEGGGNHWDEEVDSDGDPDVDDVPDDIDDEDVNNDEDINASLVGEQMWLILIHNNLGLHMSLIDLNAAYVAEFPEYPEIVYPHGLAVTSDDEELFIGQRFSLSTSTIYVGEYWKAAEGCNWRVRTAFIKNSQMWEIRKFVGLHTCTSTRMTEDHGKLDSKTICTCIMPMVKDMPTIKVSVLIAEIQARFQYRVSYQKAWIAKQMEMEQLYGDYDSSYNELQGWIADNAILRPGRLVTAGKEDFLSDVLDILLLAVAQYGNRNVLPIAFAIVDKENIESWEFFLTNLRRDPFTASVTLRLTSTKIIRMQIGRDKSWQWTGTLIPIMGQQQVNQIETGHVFVEHKYIHDDWKHFELLRPSVVELVYQLGPTELISRTDGASVGGSTHEVPPATFELLPDRGLRRNPKGRLPSSRIRNEMDIREKSNGRGVANGEKKSCAPTNLNRKESHDAADTGRTGRACRTATGRIQRVQTCRHIYPLRSSENSHRLPNSDDSYVNPHVTVIVRDLARAPAQALVVPENNMPEDPDPSGPLRSIPQVAARAGGLQSTGPQVYMDSRNYSTIVYTLMMVAGW